LQAAILRVQLPHLDAWAAHRARVGEWYAEAGLGQHAALPVATPGAVPAWHLYVVRAPEPDALVAGLNAEGIGARGYYRVPVHRQPAILDLLPEAGSLDLPGTEEAARTHLALPISAAITRDQVGEVADAVRRCASGST
jgi:dTDP-3-amino-3,4,6-trideoxy-alpha-D-glucose transaminase